MHLVAKQTLDLKSRASMLDYYASTLRAFAPRLLKISKHLAVDACFSRFPFVSSAIEMGFEVISRLRGDAHLRYAYLGPRRRGRGRPRQFAGKVDVRRPDPQHFQPIVGEVDWIAYQGRVHSKSLKRWVKVVLVHHFGKNGDLKRVGIYFSTDLSMSGADILIYYKSRFQIEFLYRDAKQFTGLEHCQSRNEKKLDFHFNSALTAVSLAKAAHHLSLPEGERRAFSMFSLKVQYFNELLLKRFFSMFGISPNKQKNKSKYLELREFGKIAA